MKRALLILAQNGYQDFEEAGTRKGLEAAGFTITVASSVAENCHGKLGGMIKAFVSLKDVQVAQYDVIAFIGGPGAMEFADDPEAHRISREAVRLEKRLGAICIAPIILAQAGVLNGKKATVWNGDGMQRATLERMGAIYTGEEVTADQNIITANGPAAAEEFGKVI